MLKLTCLLTMFLLPLAAAADEGEGEYEGEDDHEEREAVREAVEHGRIKPLSEIMQKVRDKLPGEIIGVEAIKKGGVWIYAFRVTGRNGRRYQALVDAATAEVLTLEER